MGARLCQGISNGWMRPLPNRVGCGAPKPPSCAVKLFGIPQLLRPRCQLRSGASTFYEQPREVGRRKGGPATASKRRRAPSGEPEPALETGAKTYAQNVWIRASFRQTPDAVGHGGMSFLFQVQVQFCPNRRSTDSRP